MGYASSRWTLLAVLCYSAPAIGQIGGRFYLEKNTFALGEPVFLNFEASNSAREPQDIIRADPYSPCAGYEIHLSGDPSPTCPLLPEAGSCWSSWLTLGPGARHNERILINYAHQIIAPGNYVVEASRLVPYGPGGGRLLLQSTEEFHGRMEFFVDGTTKFDSEQLKAWVDQLQSADIAKRFEAGRTLASLAPVSIESTLLGFIEDGRFTSLAPLAMHRLNTPRSIAALAAILRRTQPGTPENSQSAQFLASSGDPQWFPLLLALARKRPADGSYYYPAAESGGDRAVPIFIELMHSGSGPTRQVAISALAYTGSRAAVPVLLDLLKNSDSNTSERALYGLRELTHRTLPGASVSPQLQYPKWLEWWSRYSDSARIYKPTDCGEFIPLSRD